MDTFQVNGHKYHNECDCTIDEIDESWENYRDIQADKDDD